MLENEKKERKKEYMRRRIGFKFFFQLIKENRMK